MFETSSDLAQYLSSGERVLWQGRSRRRLGVASGGAMLFLGIFVAIAVMVFVIFAIVVSERGLESDDAVVGLVILPIILLAVGLGVGIPLWAVSRRYGNSHYAVTSSAAMIVSEGGWSGRQVLVVPLQGKPQLSLIENRDGTGTIVFGQNMMMAANMRYAGGWWTNSMPAFWNIERPLEVYQLIRRQVDGT